MNRASVLLICLLLVAFISNAQHGDDWKGIKFEKSLSWQEVLAKAKSENKYIFVDCFATWCGPCKFLSDSIFSKKEAGDFMNERFINVKAQMDQTAKDNEYVKSWYNDGKMMMSKYKIEAFPTLLFISPEGELISRAVGGFANPASFVARAEKALDTDEQYFFLLEQYNKGQKDSNFMNALLKAAEKAGDKKMIDQIKKKKSNS